MEWNLLPHTPDSRAMTKKVGVEAIIWRKGR